MTTLLRVDRFRAMRAAGIAASRALPASSCPFDPEGSPRQRALALIWTREYLRLNPPPSGAVDYDA